MTSTRTTPATVLERFPDHWHLIVDLCRQSEDFHELCDHYAECAQVLDRLQSTEGNDLRRIPEYEEVITSLEVEIQKMISASH